MSNNTTIATTEVQLSEFEKICIAKAAADKAQSPRDEGNRLVNAITGTLPACAYKFDAETGIGSIEATFPGNEVKTIATVQRTADGKFTGEYSVGEKKTRIPNWAAGRFFNYCTKGGSVKGGSKGGSAKEIAEMFSIAV